MLCAHFGPLGSFRLFIPSKSLFCFLSSPSLVSMGRWRGARALDWRPFPVLFLLIWLRDSGDLPARAVGVARRSLPAPLRFRSRAVRAVLASASLLPKTEAPLVFCCCRSSSWRSCASCASASIASVRVGVLRTHILLYFLEFYFADPSDRRVWGNAVLLVDLRGRGSAFLHPLEVVHDARQRYPFSFTFLSLFSFSFLWGRPQIRRTCPRHRARLRLRLSTTASPLSLPIFSPHFSPVASNLDA
ncbi:hypothetical protein B0H16DRAFT_1548680 [Mycena metata]|uniref:Uncharacterized protein n=1 Tax=Mycena metata TaxID=1033252 RepID=A0AAD7IW93_9AGAR|nr:hypothetical protein B0H16DRAFT_1548680 [Mycena metata]